MKNEAVECPHTLFVIVCDEAHYGATSGTSDLNNGGDQSKPSPYAKLAGSWNSEDYPNVVVLLVSATAWNLQTSSSRIDRSTEVLIDPSREYEIREIQRENTDRYRRTKTLLHEVHWNNHLESELKYGKDCRLLVRVFIKQCRQFKCMINTFFDK